MIAAITAVMSAAVMICVNAAKNVGSLAAIAAKNVATVLKNVSISFVVNRIKENKKFELFKKN